jgi:transposase InsO family protein
MKERIRFVMACEENIYTMTELCERFSISRKTGYKWLERYRTEGLEGLQERSRLPHNCPHRTPGAIADLIAAESIRYRCKWGPRKLRRLLQEKHPEINWPPTSTMSDILKRRGLTVSRRRSRRVSHTGAGTLVATAPNQVWSTDYKGQAKVGGDYCYPLTILDSSSRYLLSCQGLRSTSRAEAWPVYQEAFHTYGLPEAIRTDNGTPFVSSGRLGLTQLSVWWLKLGIGHQRIRPGKPQDNGRHERMHRTLKQDTMMPPATTMQAQQRRFDHFREEYNNVRPHQSLDDQVPAARYAPSHRAMPDRIEEPNYPGHFEIRKVTSNGEIRFKNAWVFLSLALAGEHVGLEEIDLGVWDVVFYDTSLARYNQQTNRLS